MQQEELTFEQIDAHIKNANLNAFTTTKADLAPGDLLQKVCAVYNVIRPILSGLSQIPFIPAAWKAAIKTFMSVMDTICA